ncbi:MAG TPA: DUF423 domain-containing protein [Burkholderiaceae bacterium]|nr:DUF423 domain-containing protein [Burkholderiaceae bacterium]
MSARTFALAGALFGFAGVAAGAFGAHGLRARLSADALAVFETAVRYQLVHALALFAAAWASSQWPGRAARAGGWLFVTGIVLFSGSLYLLAVTGLRSLGTVAPLGGLSLLAGWLALAWSAWRGGARG